MKENIDNLTEFFPSSKFNNQLFYLYCPFLQNQEKSKIYENITRHQGVSQKILLYIIYYFIRNAFIHLIPRQ